MLEVSVLTHQRYVANVNYFEMPPDVTVVLQGQVVKYRDVFVEVVQQVSELHSLQLRH